MRYRSDPPLVCIAISDCHWLQVLECLPDGLAQPMAVWVALWKTCGLELARGLSTGLTVAAAARCPACSPILTCATPAACPVLACPSCVCGDSPRLSAVCPLPPSQVVPLLGVLVVGLVVGFGAHALLAASRRAPLPIRGRGIWLNVDSKNTTSRALPGIP